MSSLNALKYKITVNPSYYAGAIVFLLYFAVILLSLLVVSTSIPAFLLYLILFSIALYAAYKARLQHSELLISESGLVESIVGEKSCSGKIGPHCFYNGFFIFLQLDMTNSGLVDKEKTTKQFIIIYKDAIYEEQYRLLARLINSGRS